MSGYLSSTSASFFPHHVNFVCPYPYNMDLVTSLPSSTAPLISLKLFAWKLQCLLIVHLPYSQDGYTTPKDALDVSAAERVYGDPLVIHAKFVLPAASSNDLQRICQVVGKFTPCHLTYKPPAKHHTLTGLHSTTHVILRNDTSKSTLKPPYKGPYLVIRRNPKAFLLNICGNEDWVSNDRLESAYLLPDESPTVRLSRSGHPN
ncbi:uncharacterized protein [Palaemon carinicauda]|uniref:uncharacterized protein n=1 Tax=Palaemon carinicauda TaxID=392227 RepID=UPI0035B63F09